MKKHSIFSLVRNALSSHERWPPMWRSPDPKPAYDVVIVGGGGHGLATAYYLAKEHRIRNVAVLERSWLGGGSTGRNTEVVRSNYLWDESSHLYEHSLKLWERLSQELNFNLMLSQRGVLFLGHSPHEIRELARRVHANRLNGIDAELLTVDQVKALVPILNTSPTARYPVLGGALQRRGGTARHDAIAWGYARAADALGVDIIQQCEVTGIRREDGQVTGVETSRGFIHAPKVALAVAGNTSVLAALAGVRLPIQSRPLQAWVSEPLKPVLHVHVVSNAVHAYINQTDKGELLMGGGTDPYNSYAYRGSLPAVQGAIAAVVELFPIFSRVRMNRQWAGTVDIAPDACPIIAETPVRGLFVNTGWGTGGFKATPGAGWVYAHTIAAGRPHPLNEPFSLDRFTTGALIDEHGAAGVAH